MELLTHGHLEDGDLIALLDDEVEGAARDQGEAHLAACTACRAQADRYRLRRARLARLLERSDFAPSPASSTPPISAARAGEDGAAVLPLRRRPVAPQASAAHPWLRAAAIVVLMLTAGVIATPARAWISRWIGQQWARVAQHPEQPAPRPRRTSEPATPQVGAQVRFIPSGSDLRVEIPHAQPSGTLTLLLVDGATASAAAIGPQGADLLVTPSGLRIRNTSETSADYRVEVPPSVRRIRVRIGTHELIITRDAIRAGGHPIPLTGS